MLQASSSKEKEYLPLGRMRWQYEPVNTVEGWMSIPYRDKEEELLDAALWTNIGYQTYLKLE